MSAALTAPAGLSVADVVRTARVEHRCTNSSWHAGCGRTIAKGERYLSFKRGALSSFAVCTDCALRSAAEAARAQVQA